MIAIVLGTSPEIIKMSPVIRECERRGEDYFILHTELLEVQEKYITF